MKIKLDGQKTEQSVEKMHYNNIKNNFANVKI